MTHEEEEYTARFGSPNQVHGSPLFASTGYHLSITLCVIHSMFGMMFFTIWIA
jgi:hypothetical protein